MHIVLHIISVGIVATLAMTAFSYAFSYVFHGNYKEPQLLNYLIDNLPMVKSSICREHLLGWTIHCATGMAFVTAFIIFQHFYEVDYSALTGAIYGLVAGIIGVVVWAITFWLHPDPPGINKTLYLAQLVFAHLIFGIVAVLLLPIQ